MGQFGGLFNGGMGSVAGQNTGGYGGTTTATPDASGKLVEYNPNTMSTPFKPAAQPTPIDFNTAGMDASGIPNYLSNWLASGAQGTAPTAPQPASTAPTIAQGPVAIGTATPAPKKIGTGAMTGSGGYGGPLPAATTTAGATSSTPGKSAPGLTQVGGSNGLQAPLAVNDQWNFQGGTSLPVASPPHGAAGQGQAPFWTDSKGNYFYDAAGTKPVTGGAATQLKNQFG